MISFACYDFRRDAEGRFVPLDFGARLGGDGNPFLVRWAGGTLNPYAAALESALADDPRLLAPLQAGTALIHAFARQEGVLEGLSVDLPGEIVNARSPGYRIESQGPGSIMRPVGSILTRFTSHADFLDACRRSSEWTRVSYQ